MTKDEALREAITSFMREVDASVSYLERSIQHDPHLEKEDRLVWREELKLWKKAQAIGLRAAQKVSDV